MAVIFDILKIVCSFFHNFQSPSFHFRDMSIGARTQMLQSYQNTNHLIISILAVI